MGSVLLYELSKKKTGDYVYGDFRAFVGMSVDLYGFALFLWSSAIRVAYYSMCTNFDGNISVKRYGREWEREGVIECKVRLEKIKQQ